MKRIFFSALAFLFLNFPSITSAQTNTVTLTSYYPAPFGAYDRLRLVPRTPDLTVCTPTEHGTLYVPSSSGIIQYCNGTTWGPLSGGVWQMKNAVAIPGRTIPADQYIPAKIYAADLDTVQPYVGIGTDDPQAPIHIVTSSLRSSPLGAPAPAINIQNLSSAFGSQSAITFSGRMQSGGLADFAFIKAIHNITSGAGVLTSSLVFNVRNGGGAQTDVLSIFGEQGGKIGIRNSNPQALLSIKAGPNILPYLHISDKDSNNGNILIVKDDGTVGINQVNPTEKLEVVGNIKATTLILTSDAGLKKDIVPVENSLDKISRLKGVSFEWKDNPTDQRKHMGVIAQNVEKIFPEAVYGKEGAKGVDYPSLIAPLIEAVKELKEKNEVLSQQLQAQSTQIREQQQKIDSLQSSLEIKEPALNP